MPRAKKVTKTRLYIVDTLSAMRVDPLTKKRQVLVKWRGYPSSASTWEPYENLVQDGFTPELRALSRKSNCAYLFLVRFRTPAKHRAIYLQLKRFLQQSNAGYSEHIPGNVHALLDLKPDQVSAFTESFREWLKGISPAGCIHAQLMKLSSDESPGAMSSVYPVIN